MFEKVNCYHPDKVADRIAGALIDAAYSAQPTPRVAAEVLIGHGVCHIIAESSYRFPITTVQDIVDRIDGKHNKLDLVVLPQDIHLSENQNDGIKCGDNGIFKGTPVSDEQRKLSDFAKEMAQIVPYDGKYLVNAGRLTVCQSNASTDVIVGLCNKYGYNNPKINPLGYWTGGTNVDSGATNRKLGSDMGDGLTGGGLMGKDLSKADVSINVYCFIKAQELGKPYSVSCSIGDAYVDGRPYSEIVEIAADYIKKIGGFEKFAEYGLL